MKFYKYLAAGLVASTAIVGLTGCSEDFLDEEMPAGHTTAFFQTSEGIQSLTRSLYGHIRWWAGYEGNGDVQTMQGTDEFGIGTDACNEMWLTYDNRMAASFITVNGNTGTNAGLWDELYYGIAAANKIIASADLIKDESVRNSCLAQAYFLRGFNYYQLTAQFGRCVIQTVPADGVIRTFEVKTPKECWEQVISDFRDSYNLFEGEDQSFMGAGITWTKASAAHFLAKACLFAASERNNDWNADVKKAYLEEGLKAADYAISARSLEIDVIDLYGNWDKPDAAIEKSSENLMVAPQNANFPSARTNIRNIGAHFNPQFSNWAKTTVLKNLRGCITGGKDFQRYRPTEYLYSAYDIKNDARLFKAFRTVYGAATEYKHTYADGTTHTFKVGDPAIVMIFNTPNDNKYDKFTFGAVEKAMQTDANFVDEEGRLPVWTPGERPVRKENTRLSGVSTPILDSWIMYKNGQFVGHSFGATKNHAMGAKGSNMWAGISKHACGYLNAFAGDNGSRDVVLARLAETYLVRAEIKIRLEDYPGAKNDINAVRKRAAWHEGENRGFYVDGNKAAEQSAFVTADAKHPEYIAANQGWNLGINSYYLSNHDLTPTTASTEAEMTDWDWNRLPKEDEAILAKLGVSSQFDRALHFILNEHSRELCGEFVRWETLSRTKQLENRAVKLNPDVNAFNPSKHYLRPVPQAFIDGLLQDNGANLTDEQKAAWQNPGY